MSATLSPATSPAASPAASPALSDDIAIPHRGLITASAMLAMFMQVLDTSICVVALPYMQGSLSASAE